MSIDAVIDEAEPSVSPRRAALGLVPFAALGVAVCVAVLWALTLPSSHAQSEDSVIVAVAVMWLAVVSCLVVAAWTAGDRRARRGGTLSISFLLLLALGWVVARRIDSAWIDACEFGQSGDRCTNGDGSAPPLVLAAWPIAGAVFTAGCGLVSALGRSAAHA